MCFTNALLLEKFLALFTKFFLQIINNINGFQLKFYSIIDKKIGLFLNFKK